MNILMKIACLSILIIGSGLRAMDVVPVEKASRAELNEQLQKAALRGEEKVCKSLIDEMVKLKKDQKDEVVAFSASLRRTAGAKDLNLDMRRLIVRMMSDDIKRQNKYKVAREIEKIGNVRLRKKLLAYLISPNEKLLQAAREGDLKRVNSLIEEGIDVNGRDEHGATALMVAAWNNHKTVCNVLVANHADVNAANTQGITALMPAAGMGYREICELLIADGAQVNAKSNDGETALMWAARTGRDEICKLLIDLGANVNAQSERGFTAWMYAAQSGHKYVCELLIELGADANAKTNIGSDLLREAASKGDIEICKLLIAHGADVNAVDDQHETALMKAEKAKIPANNAICKLLIAHGADVTIEDNNHMTALMRAANLGRMNVCKIIIEAMIKPTPEEVDSVVALLGSLERTAGSQHLQAETRRLIVQTRLNDLRLAKKPNARAQIMRIPHPGMRSQLLNYLNNL